MKIPEPEYSITNLIDKHHESRQEPPRPHLGRINAGSRLRPLVMAVVSLGSPTNL
jgi:hypothetical protein